MISAQNFATGEIIELPTNTPEQIVQAWNIAREYEKAATALKDQLKRRVPEMVNERGLSEEVNGYMFRVSNIQRMNYDKSVLRDVLDADTFDLMLEPSKTKIDDYLKENLEELGDASSILRNTMQPVGKAYQTIKLEKVSRD